MSKPGHITNLIPPKCSMGYTVEQVAEIVSDADEFNRWMWGQTMAICPDHGPIVYADDVDRFLKGLPNID